MTSNKNFAKFINIDGKYRFYNDESDLIKIYQEQIDQLTNNWNELEDILKIKKARILNEPDYSKYYLGGYETAIQATHSSHSGIMLETAKKSIVVLCDELLDKMKEIKEGNNDK